MSKFYFNKEILPANTLASKTGLSPNSSPEVLSYCGVYKLLSIETPESRPLEYPTGENLVEVGNFEYNYEIVYSPRPLTDAKSHSITFITEYYNGLKDSARGGIDPLLLQMSAPEEFADIKAQLAQIAHDLSEALAAVNGAQSISDLQDILNNYN